MDEAIRPIVDQCVVILSNRPAGLLTDIDGTVSFIAPTPDAASVNDSAKHALGLLAKLLDVVGTVSGRAAENSEAMVGVPGVLYIGNHGLEQRIAGATSVHPLAQLAVQSVADALDSVRASTQDRDLFAGVLFENKGVTGSIHYRLAPDQEAARLGLLALLVPEANLRGLRVTEGRMVIELRPAIAINKGSALDAVVKEYGLKSLIFLGDDVTDLDGFTALARLRAEGVISGLNIAVVSSESAPEVENAADVIVHGVDACVSLLASLATELTRGG